MLERYCRGKPLVICSDSQSTLEALNGYLVRSREVLWRKELLGELSRANSLRLLWVPMQFGVVRNDKADRFANRGSRSIRGTFYYSIGAPECYLEELIGKWLEQIALKMAGKEWHKADLAAHWTAAK